MNVSKGEVAKSQELKKSFNTTDVNTIVKEVCVRHALVRYPVLTPDQILQKGELQVGDKEREHDLSSVRREIATLVAEKCVDPATQRPYPVGVIDKAMTEAGFSVRPGKNAKAQVRAGSISSAVDASESMFGCSQVSECIKLLQTNSKLPIQRARMRVRVSLPVADVEKVKPKVLEGADSVEKDEQGADEWEAVS